MVVLSHHRRWGVFRHGVVAPLRSSPPRSKELVKAIEKLAKKIWKHPITGEDTTFSASTIQAWYYQMLANNEDPVGSLNRKVRKDRGQKRAITDEIEAQIREQYGLYPWWTVELHEKNLRATLTRKAPHCLPPSYATLRRFMRANGLKKLPKPKVGENGQLEGLTPTEEREVACFEVDAVNQIWSLDFHHGKLRVLGPDGSWRQPIVAAILDHGSRLACHVAWGFYESTEELVSCYSKAVMKRGRPRITISDNGGAMKSGEFEQGLGRLGIELRKIRPRTPRQNGKTECFWSSLESNLVSMLIGQKDLTLDKLNKITQAWAEVGYNRKIHREIRGRPIDRFISLKNIGLPAVNEDALRRAFRIEVDRSPRSSDKTIRIDGTLFRLPQRYRHLQKVNVRYARWNLGFVHLVDPQTGKELDRIYPVDKIANADRQRRVLEQPVAVSSETTREELPSLLKQQIHEFENLTRQPIEIDTQKEATCISTPEKS